LLASSRARAQPGETPPPTPPAPSTTPDAPPPDEAPKPPLGPLPTGLVPPPAPEPPPAPPPFAPPPRLNLTSWELAKQHGAPTFRWDLDFYGSGEVDTFSYPDPRHHETSLVGDAGLSLTRFLAPIVDDDAPHSLQAYLQRASAVSMSFDAGGFAGSIGFGNRKRNQEQRDDVDFGPTVGADVYLTPAFAVTAGFGYRYDVLNDTAPFEGRPATFTSKTHELSPSGGVALRLDDTRIDLDYAVRVNVAPGSFLVSGAPSLDPKWGTIALSIETVLNRRTDLDLTGEVFDGGAGCSASAEEYFTKTFGLFVGGFAYFGRRYNDGVSHNDYGGDVGLSWWAGPRLRLLFEYELAGVNVPAQEVESGGYDYSSIRNRVYGSLRLRLP
jgi:hypothetical protein